MLTIIAAIGQNNELGRDNHLLWSLPSDLKFFRTMTMGKKMIMGNKTFASLGKPLPGRDHLIVTHNPIISEHDRVFYINNLSLLIDNYRDVEEEIFVIGGAQIYKQFIDYVQNMYLTEIEATTEADAYFPTFNKNDWLRNELANNQENGISYKHVKYKRK